VPKIAIRHTKLQNMTYSSKRMIRKKSA